MQLNIPSKYFFSGIDFGLDCKDFITPLENVLDQFDKMYSGTLDFKEFHTSVINKFIRYRNVDTSRYFNSTQEGEKLDNTDIERYLAARNEENQTISDLTRQTNITLGDWAEQRLAQGADAVMNKVKHQIRERFGQEILSQVEQTVKFGDGMDILSGLNVINEGYKDTLASISSTIAQIQKTISALINVGEAFQQLYDVTTVQYLVPNTTTTTPFRFTVPTQVIEGFQNFELDIVSDLNKIYRMVEKNISETVVQSLRLNIAKYMYYRDYINRIQQFNFLQVGLQSPKNELKKDDLTFVKWKEMLQPGKYCQEPVTRPPVPETLIKRYVDAWPVPPPTVPIRDFSDNNSDYIQQVKERMSQRPTNVSETHQRKAHAKRRVRRMRRGLVTGQTDLSSDDLEEGEIANILGLDLANVKLY